MSREQREKRKEKREKKKEDRKSLLPTAYCLIKWKLTAY
jgi:hypothetical protein